MVKLYSKSTKDCKKWSSYVKPDYKNALLHKINFDYLFGQTCHALRAHPNNDDGLLIFFSSHHCCNQLARTIQLLSSWQDVEESDQTCLILLIDTIHVLVHPSGNSFNDAATDQFGDQGFLVTSEYLVGKKVVMKQ